MQGDINELIAKHKGLVYKQLHKFCLVQDPEAESIAYEALYNALQNYDSSRGTAVSTVATVYIYNALGSYVRTLNKQRQIQTISYNNIAYTDGDEEHEYVDTLALNTDVEQEYIRKESGQTAIKVFSEEYAKLTNEKHKQILYLWRASDFEATTKEIAVSIGVSQSYVSQVINNFKFKLRKRLEEIWK